MLVTAITVAPVSWVAGDPDTETRRVHEKTREEHYLTQKNVFLLVFNYIFILLEATVYNIALCGIAYGDVLRCSLRRQQTA